MGPRDESGRRNNVKLDSFISSAVTRGGLGVRNNLIYPQSFYLITDDSSVSVWAIPAVPGK